MDRRRRQHALSDTNNWSAGSPSSGGSVVLTGSSQNNLSSLSLGSLYLVPSLEGQSITGNTLAVGSGGIHNLGQTGSTITNDINFSGNSMIFGNSGQIFTGSLQLGTGTSSTLTLTGRGAVFGDFSEVQSSGLLLKNDANWVVGERSVSALTGTIRIESGALSIVDYNTNIAILSSINAKVALAGGSLYINNETSLTNNLEIDGASSVINAKKNIRIAGSLSGSGTLNKYGEGTLEFDHSIGGSSVNLNIAQGNLELRQSSGTYSGVISGDGSVTVAFPGELILNGQNGYTGGTEITSGATLGINSDRNLGTPPPGVSPSAPTTPPPSNALLNINTVVSQIAASGSISNAGSVSSGNSSSGASFSVGSLTLTNGSSGAIPLSGILLPPNVGSVTVFSLTLTAGAPPTLLGAPATLGVGTNHQIASSGLTGSGILVQGEGRELGLTQSVSITGGPFNIQTNDGVRTVTGTYSSTPSSVTDITVGNAGFVIVPYGIVSSVNPATGTLTNLQPFLNSITPQTAEQQLAQDTWTTAQSPGSVTTTAGQGGVSLSFNGRLKVYSDILTYRSFDFQFLDGIIDVQSSQYYIAGNISGGGRLVKEGPGLLTLAGENSLSGGILVNQGALLGNSESLKGNIETASATSVFFEQSTDGIYSGSLSGSGSFIKIGASQLKITGDSSTFAGTSWVLGGTLSVNGNLGGDLVVGENGVLKGSGLIMGNVVNYGTISPGNSPGTLHVGGNLVLTPGSTLQMEVNGLSLGQYDQIQVGGAAFLDGTLQLVLGPGISLANGQSLQFITATGGITGQFTSVTSNLGNALGFQLSSNGNNIVVQAVQNSFIPFAATANQRATAGALDSAVSNPKEAALINLLNAMPGTLLANAYDQIAPEELGAMNNIALSYNSIQHSNMERRLADIRSGSRGFSANGLALLDFDSSLLLADGGDIMAKQIASDPTRSPMRLAPDNRWGVFATGTGQFGDVNSNSGSSGYDFTSAGITVGLDYRVSDQLAIGLALGYAGSNADLGGSGGNIDTNRGLASVYGTWYSDGFYVNGVLGGGDTSYNTERNVLGGKAIGDTEGKDFNSILGGGYEFRKGSLTFGPAASLEYSYTDISEFTESGSPAPLQIQEQENNSLRSRLGISASYDTKISDVTISPFADLAWQHEYFNARQGISAQFANGGGPVFGVQTAELGQDSALAGLGVNAGWSRSWSSYLSYNAEVSPDFINHSINGGVKFRF